MPGVRKVEVRLETDEFVVSYDAGATNTDHMILAIDAVGFRPTIVRSRLDPGDIHPLPSGPIPEPIATALNNAKKTNTPVFVDFHAEWCGACKIMATTTLVDPAVLETLKGFQVLKVDADVHGEAINHYKVVGMPTYVVLNASGDELFRHVGPIDADSLVRELSQLGHQD